ncbi:unnamed protein product [Parajaminaea phylloscopi]
MLSSLAAFVPVLVGALSLTSTASAFNLKFVNSCNYPILAGVARAPNGKPDPSVSYAVALGPNGGTGSVGIDDHLTGIRAWARTGCDGNGNNCKTGGCVGGRICKDGGLQAAVLYAEFGFANFGPKFGGERLSWDLSRVDAKVNVPASLSDGKQTVTCRDNNCPANQAYNAPADYAADRNSNLGTAMTVHYCP